MYIEDETYYTQLLEVPNVNDAGDAKTVLSGYSDKYGRLLLKKALGATLFAIFDPYIVSGVLNPAAPQKWKNLVNGATYTVDSVDYRWNGLIYTEGTFKNSILAKYSYYYWLKSRITRVTGTGEKMIEAKNASAVNSNQRLVSIWNDFLKEYQGECSGFFPRLYDYGGVRVYDYYIDSQENTFVSLLKFLSDNSTNYPDAQLSAFYDEEPKNQLGI